MANKHMKRSSTLLTIKEMTIKITRRLYFTFTRMAIIKKMDNNKCYGGCKEIGSSYIAGGNVNDANVLEISLVVPQMITTECYLAIKRNEALIHATT